MWFSNPVVNVSLSVPPSQCSFFSCSDSDFSMSLSDYGSSRYSDLSDYLSWLVESDPIQFVIDNEAYCFDVCKFSEKLVDAVFQEATAKLSNSKNSFTVFDVVCPIIDVILDQTFHPDLKPESEQPSGLEALKLEDFSIIWPKNFEFNIKLGQEQIEQYVNTWVRSSDWMFSVEFLGFEGEDSSNVFVYEVEWSKPTKSYPVPQATASVYFALEVYKMIPFNRDRNVDVTYVFECSSMIHKPGKIDFQEPWLELILNEKLEHFKRMSFSVPAGVCGPSRPTMGNDYWPNSHLNFCGVKKKNYT